MNKIDFVTREVIRIVDDNCSAYRHVSEVSELLPMRFNVTSGRHEIECFFAIEFEQEQVDAWKTVQNIIDDVMNLWVSPITDPVIRGADPEAVQRVKYQLGENEAKFSELVRGIVGHAYQNNPMFVDVPENPPVVRIENNPSKSGVVGEIAPEAIMPPFRMEKGQMILNEVALPRPEIMTDDTIAAMKNMPPVNRIERADVERFATCRHGVDTLNYYQSIATKSAIYPGKGTPFGLMYAALGLAEAGEVQNKVKKAFRDDGVISFHPIDKPMQATVTFQPITPERRAQIIKELGGVLWYIAAVCDEIGATMSEVALQNLDELCGRGERNTLRGDGDNR